VQLKVDSIESCVMCHDNSRNGSRRLDKYLHLIHFNRDNFPATKNHCAVCRLSADGIEKVHFEVCSNCHENLHNNNQPKYTDAQCIACHQDFSRGHVGPIARANDPTH
jgi:ribosomal protein L32